MYSIRSGWLVRKRDVRKDVPISVILEVLLVFEDWVEIVHAVSGQESDVSDHAGHTADGKGSPTEANEDNFITGCVVGSDKTVDFPNVLPGS